MFYENDVRKAISILKPDNEPFEIRVKFKDKSLWSGYFNDIDVLIKEMNKLPKGDCNMYISLNALKDALMSRSQSNKFSKKTDATTSDKDIEGYEWLLVDIDPQRPADTPSSDEELKNAKVIANDVYKFLDELGFEKPIFALSGNGCHLLYRIALANTTDNKNLLKKCLDTLDMFFSNDEIKIDTSVFNPARICKLYGSVAMKGTPYKTRVHRKSEILGDYHEVKVMDKAYLTKLTALYPEQEESKEKYNNYNPNSFNVEEWLSGYSISYRKSTFAGGDKYILGCCPFNSEHKGKDACVFRGNNGALSFHCFHSSCSDKTWKM